MRTPHLTSKIIPLLLICGFGFSSLASADDLKEIMSNMKTEFVKINSGFANPTPETALAASNLRKLALQAAELPPVSDPVQVLDFQRLLTLVALDSILLQDAFLKSDASKAASFMTDLKTIMKEGHTKFK